jgi:hypothetical protein
MPKVNGVRQTTVGTRKVMTPSGESIKRDFDAGYASWLRRRGQQPETRAQVRARFMGRVMA